MAKRDWCFTLNNFASTSIDWPATVKYAVWQHEVGDGTDDVPKGTHHLQGYVEFKAVTRLSACRKILSTAHWEPRKGTDVQARDYCMKDDTHVAGPWEHGTFVASAQGSRSDLTAACALVKAGGVKRVAEEMPEMFVKFERGLKALEFTLAAKRDWVMDARVYWGAAGAGKTRAVYDEFGADNIYVKDPTTEWWDGYNGEECVLVDEFYGTLKFSYLQRLLDRYPMPVQIKGGTTHFRSKVIVFTSNVPWTQWFEKKFEQHPEVKLSFERRVTTVREF